MRNSNWRSVTEAALNAALPYLESLPTRDVQPSASAEEIRAVFADDMPEHGEDPAAVVSSLAADLDPYITAHASGRYFGFVIGGTHPAALGAEWLVSAWDQNAGLFAVTPGAAVVEETVARWLIDLLSLPGDASVGFVTGGQMANLTCLAAARDRVLGDWSGWDVEADGLHGAPEVQVIVKTQRHGTIPRSLRFLGLGGERVSEVASDDQGRMDVDALAVQLEATTGPTIVCLEAGNVNTGSFDRFAAIAEVVDAHRARGNPTWVHVDGAVGLWACATDSDLTAGIELMDSWSTDAHKLLNVTYDSGIAICRDADAHRRSMSTRADYLIQGDDVREPMDWNPEHSRRARGVVVYAVLRSLGVSGVVDLVERTSAHARRFAAELAASGLAEIVNDVVLNQVLVRWIHPDGDDDGLTERVIARVAASGVAYFSPTTWEGRRLMRISVADWATDDDDVDRSVAALLAAAREG